MSVGALFGTDVEKKSAYDWYGHNAGVLFQKNNLSNNENQTTDILV